MRLLRAILLNHLKTIMETPGKKLTPEQLEKIGVMANGKGHEAELATTELTNELIRARPDGEVMIDDSSEESDEDEPEVASLRLPVRANADRLPASGTTREKKEDQ